MTARVRPGRPEDADALRPLLVEVATEGDTSPRQLDELRSREDQAARYQEVAKNGAWLVAEEDGAIVGYLLARRGDVRALRHTADVAISVARLARGRGVGRALMLAAETWARGAGVRKLTLGVYADNARALRLYDSLGYARDGIRTAMFGDGRGGFIDEILMSKDVGP